MLTADDFYTDAWNILQDCLNQHDTARPLLKKDSLQLLKETVNIYNIASGSVEGWRSSRLKNKQLFKYSST